jgi:hypothetical protein
VAAPTTADEVLILTDKTEAADEVDALPRF